MVAFTWTEFEPAWLLWTLMAINLAAIPVNGWTMRRLERERRRYADMTAWWRSAVRIASRESMPSPAELLQGAVQCSHLLAGKWRCGLPADHTGPHFRFGEVAGSRQTWTDYEGAWGVPDVREQ